MNYLFLIFLIFNLFYLFYSFDDERIQTLKEQDRNHQNEVHIEPITDMVDKLNENVDLLKKEFNLSKLNRKKLIENQNSKDSNYKEQQLNELSSKLLRSKRKLSTIKLLHKNYYISDNTEEKLRQIDEYIKLLQHNSLISSSNILKYIKLNYPSLNTVETNNFLTEVIERYKIKD